MKRRIITALALAAVVGVGAGVGSIALNSSKTVETKATGTKTIYVDPYKSWNGKGTTGQIKVHYFGGSSSSSWPGIDMAKDASLGYSYVEIPEDTTTVVFNLEGNGGDWQTENLTLDDEKPFWTITTDYGNGTNQKASCQVLPDFSKRDVYVLDKTNDLLKNNHYIHYWNSLSGRTDCVWNNPKSMDKVGTSHIYTISLSKYYDRVIFRATTGNDGKTADLSVDAECSVLESNWNGTKWISYDAANYIDSYLHFYDVSESDDSKGTACLTYYGIAKENYALLSESAKKDVVTVSGVVDRLTQWAEANKKSFEVKNDVGVFGSKTVASLDLNNGSNENNFSIFAIAGVAVFTVAAAAGYIFLRRRKESR